jgi:hypothetical protein
MRRASDFSAMRVALTGSAALVLSGRQAAHELLLLDRAARL